MSLEKHGLKGKGAVVTGSAQGIGRGVAMKLGELGVNVIVADLERQKTNGEETSELVKKEGGEGVQSEFHAIDATKPESLTAAIEACVTKFGDCSIVVGCVGGGPTFSRGMFLDHSYAEYHRTLDSTQHSAYYTAHTAATSMRKRDVKGTIVLIGSIMSDFSQKNNAAYSSAKCALKQMAKTAAHELAQFGIRVNVVQPGYIDTPGEREMAPPEDMEISAQAIPLGRLGLPEDIGNIVAFLCSDAAAYVTGSVFDCDGGYMCALGLPGGRDP